MKKIVSMILVLILALSLVACGGDATPTDPVGSTSNDPATGTAPTTDAGTAQTGAFQVGYGIGDLTPYDAPNGYASYVNVICIAMTDAQDNTALLMSVDAGGIEAYIEPIQKYVQKEYGIPSTHLIISAVHQHNTGSIPEATRIQEAKKAVDMAMADRAPAEMYINSVQTEALTFVRHYWAKDPNRSLVTDNHNEKIGATYGYEGHEREPDNEMQLVKFDRGAEKEPIILVNFQAHPVMSIFDKAVSGDFPAILRQTAEKELGAKVIYVSGASGNLSGRTRIASDLSYHTEDWRSHGKKGAKYVIDAEDSYTKVETGTIKTYTEINPYRVGKELNDPNMLEAAYEVQEARKISDEEGNKVVEKYFPNLQSIHHAKYMVIRHELGDTYDLNIGAIAIGDVAFTFHSYEVFDDNGEELKRGTVGNDHYAEEDQLENPYAMTVICTLANGHNGYCPDAIGYQNGGYSTDITRYAPGTGEELVTDYLQILNDLHAQ